MLLEPLPLNSEQRLAVQRGANTTTHCHHGAAWHGKIQVVTSLLINAAFQGKRVLFASKNNKAVDVVEDRVNALGSRPVLLSHVRMNFGRVWRNICQSPVRNCHSRR